MRKEFSVQAGGLEGIPISPNNFPCKLWRLVNDPWVHSVSWDASGLGVLVDQAAFESEVLRPVQDVSKQEKIFLTTNFSSFIRQLNLYGFKKVDAWHSGCKILREVSVSLTPGSHCFWSPSFKRGHPELLQNLRRLTSARRAKIKADHGVTRPSNLDWEAEKNGSVLAGPAHLGSLHGPSVPQLSWFMGPGVSSTPSACFLNGGIIIPGIPIQGIQPVFPWPVQYLPTAVGVQPGPQAPGFYAPEVFHYYPPSSASPDVAASAHQPSPFLPCDFDQGEEVLKEEFSLDEALQIFDALQGLS